MNKFERRILLLLAAAQFILTLDTTVMNVSISTLVIDLKTTVSGIQNAITFYALVMAAFMIAGAKIGDIIGRKRAFILGLIIYGIGSLITGLSVNIHMLTFGWSVLEGLGAALIIPAMLSLINGNFSNTKSRIKAFSTVAAMAAIGAAAGPIIGGLLTTYASWRYAFLGEVVIVLIILFRRKIIRDVKFQGKIPKFDFIGMVFSVLGLASLVKGILLISTTGFITARNDFELFGFIKFSAGGISPAIVLMVVGLLLLVAFSAIEIYKLRHKRPNLVDIRLLKQKTIRSGMFTVLSQQLIIAALMYSVSLYLQLELHYSAFRTGVALLPVSLAILIVAASATRLTNKYAPRSIIITGFILMVIGMAAVGFKFILDPTTTQFALVLLVVGAGIGLVVSQLQNLVLSSVSKNEASETSGLLATFQNLGSSLGTAISGAIMVAILIFTSANLVNQSSSFTASQKTQINSAVKENAAIVSDQALQEQLTHLPSETSSTLVSINSQSRQKAMSYTFVGVAIIGLIGLVASLGLPKHKIAD